MPITPSDLEALLKLGAQGILFISMAIAIKVLWGMVSDKDRQIIQERDKREELIRESVKASTAMLECSERIVSSLERIEQGMLYNARTKN